MKVRHMSSPQKSSQGQNPIIPIIHRIFWCMRWTPVLDDDSPRYWYSTFAGDIANLTPIVYGSTWILR
jgi:hypothetical protein